MRDDDGKVVACPACNGTDLYEREHAGNAYMGNPDDDWACYECGETFNEPKRRDEKPPEFGSGHGSLCVDEDLLDRVNETLGG